MPVCPEGKARQGRGTKKGNLVQSTTCPSQLHQVLCCPGNGWERNPWIAGCWRSCNWSASGTHASILQMHPSLQAAHSTPQSCMQQETMTYDGSHVCTSLASNSSECAWKMSAIVSMSEEIETWDEIFTKVKLNQILKAIQMPQAQMRIAYISESYTLNTWTVLSD